jgi:hypothetical protein
MHSRRFFDIKSRRSLWCPDIVRSHDARNHAIFVENQRRKIKTLTTLYVTTKDWTLIDSSLFMKNKVSIRESISHQTHSRNAEKYAKIVYCSHFYAAEKIVISPKRSYRDRRVIWQFNSSRSIPVGSILKIISFLHSKNRTKADSQKWSRTNTKDRSLERRNCFFFFFFLFIRPSEGPRLAAPFHRREKLRVNVPSCY